MLSREYFRNAFGIISVIICAGCASSPPPQTAPVPSGPTTVAASRERTWAALVSYTGESSMPVKAIDKASGLLVTDAMEIPTERRDLSDCRPGLRGREFARTSFVITGDSASSQVRAAAAFTSVDYYGNVNACSSRGVLERYYEAQVKQRAEAKQLSGSE